MGCVVDEHGHQLIACEVGIELQGPEAIKPLVQEGVGISFLSVHGLRDDFRRKRLARIRLEGADLTRPVSCVHHVDKHLSPTMEAFLELAHRTLG